MGKLHPLEVVKARLDGWTSILNSLGRRRDKANSFIYLDVPPLTNEQAEILYNNNDLAARICEIYPEEALSEGIAITLDGEDSADDKRDFERRVAELNMIEVVTEAAVWGRVHGDCLVWPMFNDGVDPVQPLDPEAVGVEIVDLRMIQRPYFSTATVYMDPLDPKYQTPEIYRVSGLGVDLLIHETRVAKFFGARTSQRVLRQNKGYHFSALHRVQEVLRDFGIGWGSAASLLLNPTQPVFKFKDLKNLIASKEGLALLEKRVAALDLIRSSSNSIAIDTEEDFNYANAAMTGVPETMDRLAQRISAATGIPVTVLMGEAPAGLNATGQSDLRMWYQHVSAWARKMLRPQIDWLLDLVAREQGLDPNVWSFEFKPPLEQTQLEEAQLQYQVAQTDAIYINAQVVQPEEVALSRWGSGKWSMQMQIDPELRKTIVDALTEDDLRPPPLELDPNADPNLDPASDDAERLDARYQLEHGPEGGSFYRTARGKKVYADALPERVARPAASDAERSAHLAPHKAALERATAAHAAAPTEHTKHAVEAAHANLREARKIAGSSHHTPKQGKASIRDESEGLHNVREAARTGKAEPHEVAQQEELLLRAVKRHGTSQQYASTVHAILEHNVSESELRNTRAARTADSDVREEFAAGARGEKAFHKWATGSVKDDINEHHSVAVDRLESAELHKSINSATKARLKAAKAKALETLKRMHDEAIHALRP